MSYIENVLEKLSKKYESELQFLNAVHLFLSSIAPLVENNKDLYEKCGLLERLLEPDRIISFKVPWLDDKGNVKVNTGFRVQFNNAIGPYKGGLRFHETVNIDTFKMLAFEQIFKNSLTGLPMGGGKGGSDFNPKGKSDNEIMRFCQSFMDELYKYIGPDTDVPAGDIGVGAREIGYLFGRYKKLTGYHNGVLTGKGLSFGGSLVRKEATGFGIAYIAENILENEGSDVTNKKVVLSGSGNVAIYACEKFTELGAKVITMSDSDGYIYDENGINLDVIKDIKEVKRDRISIYEKEVKGSKYFKGLKPWSVKCDIVSPCATQAELDEEAAKELVKNNVKLIVEGANMPLTKNAISIIKDANILYMPGKAANAGGVSVSGLEMSQNASHISWSYDEVDKKLKDIMKNIFYNVKDTATSFGHHHDYMMGANIYGLKKVADAMLSQGI